MPRIGLGSSLCATQRSSSSSSSFCSITRGPISDVGQASFWSFAPCEGYKPEVKYVGERVVDANFNNTISSTDCYPVVLLFLLEQGIISDSELGSEAAICTFVVRLLLTML